MLIKSIEKFGKKILSLLESMGRAILFFLTGMMHIFTLPVQFAKIIDQTWFIGSKSIFVIILTGLFTGMVLGLQGYYSLVKVGSEAALGAAVALTLISELGPVFTAIMVTARAGSSMAAEIGIMRISEQIDALKTMHINPVRFLFSPRIIAAVISFPLLTALFDVVGIIGGFISGSIMLGINQHVYMDTVIQSIKIHDINLGFYKAFAFAVVTTTICCYRGYYTHLYSGFGARGVSLSTTNAVVQSCISIFVFDYIITFFWI
ncbi:MAG: ABC transporter permease [Deltaproteobacteria bacterium]|uniref:MlaE family ABC transporter permease n=1 Tax=Desulfobacula sp. TaxID=2593537 RepID=UPI0019B10D68|nr:ABC transporter permease [Candidatus Desulfobacula maris]MBL6994079.1 ABC transporter permease [Desulfobacula sp.]